MIALASVTHSDHVLRRQPRHLRRVRADADRRGLPGRQRARDGLRRRARRRRVRRQPGRPLRPPDRLARSGRTSPSRSPARSGTSSARSSAGGSAPTAAGRCSSATAAGSISRPRSSTAPRRWFERRGDCGRLPRPASRRSSARSSRSRRASSASPLGRYTLLTLVGSAIWCFAFAGIGWGVGTSYRRVHDDFRWVDYAVVRPWSLSPRRGCCYRRISTGETAVPMIPLVDVKAQYAPLIPELKERFARGARVRPVHPRPERRRRSRRRRPPISASRRRSASRTARTRSSSSLDALGIGAGRRGDLPGVHVLRDREAIARRGATPVFADIDPATLNLDPEDVAARITPRTKAIMPVHLFGRPGAARRARRARPPDRRGRRPGLRRAGDRAPPASPRPSASSRPRTCSRSATAASSP